MNGNALFEALSYIDSDIITSADAAMDGKVQYIPKRKAWKTLLIAAVIASLLTVSAAASGWFGLEGHVLGQLLPTETAGIRVYTLQYIPENEFLWISAVSSPEAPEFKAQQEWGQYTADYLASKENDEEWHEYYSSSVDSWTMEQGDIARIYRLLDDEMLAELKRIAAEYGLKLHDSDDFIVNSPESIKPAWLSKFQPETDMYEYISIYEDGSFYMHAYADCTSFAESSDYTTSFPFILRRKEPVPPPAVMETEADQYAERTEWSYTTSRGEELSLTFIPGYNGWSSLYISYTYDDGYLLISAGLYDVQDLSQAEAFAERFDYSAIG
mgnify:CR=1 FL=1